MRHKGLVISFIAVLVLGGAFLLGMVVYLLMGDGGSSNTWSFGSGVGVITVDGPIISADDVVEEIDAFRKNESVKAVVLRIESPGGSVAASQEILEAVRRLAGKKPVIASMGSVAASGGYYIACGASKIVANPGTVTGSIGVRMEHMIIGDLLKWAKLGHETLKSGRLKDIGSMDRPMTEEEREILEAMLADMHVQFKEAVAIARGLDMKAVDELADGRAYTGRQALDLKLVDELGGFSHAVKIAAKLGGVSEDAKLIHPPNRRRLIERIFDSAAKSFTKQTARAMDYWRPIMMMNSQTN